MFSAAIAASVEQEWEWDGDWEVDEEPARLTGGEESAAYRVGDKVVRIGPVSRSIAEAEWCHGVAAEAAHQVPEATAPLPTKSGSTVVRVADRLVTVWPFVAGRWLDREEPDERRQAARLLARLHRALRDTKLQQRPSRSFLQLEGPRAKHPLLEDPELDRWLGKFSTQAGVHPLHGDYYRGNLLVADGNISALIDWDEAWFGPPEVELAGAAREFGDHWDTDLTAARQFIDDYQAAGGTAEPIDDETLAR